VQSRATLSPGLALSHQAGSQAAFASAGGMEAGMPQSDFRNDLKNR
jgi:hypothetical protein